MRSLSSSRRLPLLLPPRLEALRLTLLRLLLYGGPPPARSSKFASVPSFESSEGVRAAADDVVALLGAGLEDEVEDAGLLRGPALRELARQLLPQVHQKSRLKPLSKL